MATKEFLTENRDRVVKFYNNEVKGSYNTSLKSFMIDLMQNFRKVTKKDIEGYTLTDLSANLTHTKSRLGLMDVEIKVSYTKSYSDSNHAKAVAYFGKEKVQQMRK